MTMKLDRVIQTAKHDIASAIKQYVNAQLGRKRAPGAGRKPLDSDSQTVTLPALKMPETLRKAIQEHQTNLGHDTEASAARELLAVGVAIQRLYPEIATLLRIRNTSTEEPSND